MNMLDIDSLVDSLTLLVTWPHIWNNLEQQPTRSTLNYWSISLALLSIIGQIDWHAPKVTAIRSDAFSKPGESSGSAPRGLSPTQSVCLWPPTRDDHPSPPFLASTLTTYR
jgi:hypothetical protein